MKTADELFDGSNAHLLVTFSLEIWEKKTITVAAGNYSEAVKQVPTDCTFESVRKEGDEYEDRLIEYDWCYLCRQPVLGDKNGPVDRWAKIEVDDCTFWTGGGIVHESCADSLGKKVLERMRA